MKPWKFLGRTFVEGIEGVNVTSRPPQSRSYRGGGSKHHTPQMPQSFQSSQYFPEPAAADYNRVILMTAPRTKDHHRGYPPHLCSLILHSTSLEVLVTLNSKTYRSEWVQADPFRNSPPHTSQGGGIMSSTNPTSSGDCSTPPHPTPGQPKAPHSQHPAHKHKAQSPHPNISREVNKPSPSLTRGSILAPNISREVNNPPPPSFPA